MSVFTFPSHWSERDPWLHPADQRPPTFDDEFSFWEAPNNFNHAPMVIPRNRHWHGFDFRRFPGRPSPVSSPSLSNLVQATILAANMQKASVSTVNTPQSQQNFRNFLFERTFCAQNQLAEASRHFPLWFGWFLAGGALLDWTKGYCGDATTRLSFFSPSIFRCVNYYQPHRDWKPQTENYSF